MQREEIVNRICDDVVRQILEERRLLLRYSHAVPCTEALSALTALGPLVEIGAGAGYWARLLRDRGADVVAYAVAPPPEGTGWADVSEPWTPVRRGGVEVAKKHPDRVLFVCWPPRPDEHFMPALLRVAPQKTLVLITDGPGPYKDTMYELLNRDWITSSEFRIPTWPGRLDRLMVWSRR